MITRHSQHVSHRRYLKNVFYSTSPFRKYQPAYSAFETFASLLAMLFYSYDDLHLRSTPVKTFKQHARLADSLT